MGIVAICPRHPDNLLFLDVWIFSFYVLQMWRFRKRIKFTFFSQNAFACTVSEGTARVIRYFAIWELLSLSYDCLFRKPLAPLDRRPFALSVVFVKGVVFLHQKQVILCVSTGNGAVLSGKLLGFGHRTIYFSLPEFWDVSDVRLVTYTIVGRKTMHSGSVLDIPYSMVSCKCLNSFWLLLSRTTSI